MSAFMWVVCRMIVWLSVVVVGVLLVVALLTLFQRQLIYVPSRGVPPIERALPGGQAVTFETADGLRLNGWFVPPIGAPSGLTVLVFNGNGGERSLRAPLARGLAGAGHAVLLFDYRGYGDNPGQPTEAGLLADAQAARAYLLERPDVDPARLVYLGESLGAAVAVALAVEHPPVALVLRSPFSSLADVARRVYPLLPVDWLLWDRYPSLDRIERVAAPVLVVAGGRDTLVPPEQSRAVYERAAGPKEWLLVEEADHNTPTLAHGPPLLAAIERLLRLAAV